MKLKAAPDRQTQAADGVAGVSDAAKGVCETTRPLWEAVEVKWQKRGVAKGSAIRDASLVASVERNAWRIPFQQPIDTSRPTVDRHRLGATFIYRRSLLQLTELYEMHERRHSASSPLQPQACVPG